MRHWLARIAVLSALLFTLSGFAKAQDASSMVGTVTDSTGAVLPGVIVTLKNASNGSIFTQTTSKQGAYRFINVPPTDNYSVEFTHPGFATSRVDKFPLLVGVTRTQDAKLDAGSVENVVVSTGSEVTLNTTDASIGNNIDVSLLNELPIQDRTNGISTLFALQAGVDFNSGSVTGARVDQTEVTLDGLDVNDIASASTFAIVATAPVDSIEQFGGTVAGLVPAVGTGSGGQFQLVTKSGTNKFHGNINEYHRDTSTEANTFFNNLTGLRRTPLIRNQFGGNIGGPILKDKLFFFFEPNDSRIIQSTASEDIVPLPNLTGANPTLNYINNNAGCGNTSRITSSPTCISSLTAAQVATYDPAKIGFDTSVLSFLSGRFPAANDLSAGDGVNTGGYRFNVPIPEFETTYIAKVDYNLTSKQHIFVRGTINRENATSGLPVLPTDPATHPYIDRSYAYVVSHVWTIGQNKVNQFYYGDNISKLSFPNSYNPTGVNQYSFTGFTSPYSGNDGQKRRVPIPELRDDFNWQLGKHNVTFGGLFKFIKTNSNLINNFNFVGVGLSGSALDGGLNATVRPANINTGSAGTDDYDNIFASTLGVIGSISSNYNYNAAGAALSQGSGSPRAYRYFETEAYLGDTWKIAPKLTMSYGLRYQVYSVPYETHGNESVEFTNQNTAQNSTLNAYINARIAQSSSGNTSFNGLPIYSVELGGKANHGPNLYAPSYKDFAPRVGLAYHASPHTVVNGSAGIVYDRTVINTINFLQDQISYLFSNTQLNSFGQSSIQATLGTPGTPGPFGTGGNARLGANLSYNQNLVPAPAALTVPYTPYVDDAAGDATGVPGQPYGLAAGETNFIISPNLKDPYSIAVNFGIQQEFPGHMLLKISYAGRFGRRLLSDVDASQVINVPDYTGKSTQTMAQAFAGLTTQTRACQQAGTATCTLTPQPWFEDVLGNYKSGGSKTGLVNAMVGQLAPRGDMSDMLYTLAAYSVYYGYKNFLPTNIGIPSQFGANAYLTNQGNSNYHGLLVTLSKSLSQGLKFDVNYTWSHSIDNSSLSGSSNSLYSNSGFICDITQPRACRGTSDFDVNQVITGDVIYRLPIGRGKQFLGSASTLVNEAIGGWSLSALPAFRSGVGYTPTADAYLASFDNIDPAIFIGNKGDLKSHVNVDHSTNTVYNFAGGLPGSVKVSNEFRGPIGLEYGSRNIVRGPLLVNFDAGLAKNFPIYPAKAVNLIFRADFFNVLNHPNFGTPALDIVNNQSNYGQITTLASNITGASSPYRVGQFSLRLEF
jgi:hypothetical protein